MVIDRQASNHGCMKYSPVLPEFARCYRASPAQHPVDFKKDRNVQLLVPMTKPIDWRGGALRDLQDFPDGAKREAGYQLRKVQEGDQPDEFKPMPEIGSGVNEIIVDENDGWFRVMYVAKFEEAVYVLHSFQKKTNKTSVSEKDIAKRRYAAVLMERKSK